MKLHGLLSDPGHRAAALALWLLPCVLQDYRTRRVSNWLTVPLFVLAWPVALLTGNLLLTLAVFVGVLADWRWGGGLGPADEKLMVGMAALVPLTLGIGALLEMMVFVVLRLRGERETAIAEGLWLYIPSVLSLLVSVVFLAVGICSHS
jgi:Flp pilus assembly protein protease CpaA